MKRIAAVAACLLCATSARAASAPLRAETNGQYIVAAHVEGHWIEIGRLGCDRFCRTRAITLDGAARGAAAFRLTKTGGGATHVDGVTLDGASPVSCEGAAVAKLVAVDLDVAACPPEGIVATFAAAARLGSELALTARIEPEVISTEPLRFPAGNTGSPVTEHARFVPYQPGSRPGTLAVDGDLAPERLGAPFLRERVRVDSGHPQGDTFVWVMDDGAAMFVAIDFTPDNTMDGEKDYAAVHARTDAGVRTFVVSMADAAWGAPGFAATPRAAYEHKTYEFRIPLTGLPRESGGPVELAFSCYGTAAVTAQSVGQGSVTADDDHNRFLFGESWGGFDAVVHLYDAAGAEMGTDTLSADDTDYDMLPAVAYDTSVGRYLGAWESCASGSTPDAIAARLIGADGVVSGNEFEVSGTAAVGCTNCEIACDPNPASERFLVVWQDERGGTSSVYAALVDDSVTPPTVATDVEISSTAAATNPSVAFDSTLAQYVVVWEEGGAILGRLVTRAGAPSGTAQTLVAAALAPAVTYDSEQNRYALVCEVGGGSADVHMIYVSTTLVPDVAGTFEVSEASGSYAPSVSYSASADRYCVTWRTASPQAVMARFVKPDTTFAFEAFAVFRADDHPAGSAAHATNGSFCTATPWSGSAIINMPGLLVDDTGAFVTEAGTPDALDVSLRHAPTSNVVLDVAGGAGDLTISPAQLTFTASDWNTPQTVTLTAVDDDVIDSAENESITVGVSVAAGSDAAYVGAAPTASVAVTVADDEPRALTLIIAPASAGENAGVLAGEGQVATAANVEVATVVTLLSDKIDELTVPASVSIAAGASSATFDLAAVQDGVADATETVTVTASATDFTSGSDTIDVTDEAAPPPQADDCGASDGAPVALAAALLVAALVLRIRSASRGKDGRPVA